MCNAEGRQFQVFQEITDNYMNARTIGMVDIYETGPNEQLKPKHSTVGWDICMKFVDGSTEWIPLKDVKYSNLVESAG